MFLNFQDRRNRVLLKWDQDGWYKYEADSSAPPAMFVDKILICMPYNQSQMTNSSTIQKIWCVADPASHQTKTFKAQFNY